MLRFLFLLPAIFFITRGHAQEVYDLPGVSKSTPRLLDTVLKKNIPIYKVLNLEEGLYRTYASFALQRPDTPIVGIVDKERLRKAWYLTPDNKKGALIDPHTIYAVVFKGTAYVSTPWGYFPTYRKGGEYSFNGHSPTGCKELAGKKIDFKTGKLVGDE